MTLYLLRVGADSSNGGFFSVVHPDLSYLYIHVRENREDYGENRPFLSFRDMQWNGVPVSPFVPESQRDEHVHIDPEFITYTYGSAQGIPAYTTLCEMNQGDILMFYAGFESSQRDTADELKGLYIFAYFVVDSIVNYTFPSEVDTNTRQQIRNNHHFIQRWGELDGSQVIIIGNTEHSMVLKKVVPISLRSSDMVGPNYYPSAEIQNLLGGYARSLNMSSIRTFNDEQMIENFINYVNSNGEGRLDPDSDFYHSFPGGI